MEKPILFNTEMVKAIESGKKTVTRRPVKKRKPCEPGDRLWVRETWQDGKDGGFVYRAQQPEEEMKWKPSIFMPKEAARVFLTVTAVRQETLGDLTEEEAKKEGFESLEECVETLKSMYRGANDETAMWVVEFLHEE